MNNNLRSRQLNPCDDLFWRSRGYPQRPRNWQQLLEDMGYYDEDSDESSSDTESSEYDDTESSSESEFEEPRNYSTNQRYLYLNRQRSAH